MCILVQSRQQSPKHRIVTDFLLVVWSKAWPDCLVYGLPPVMHIGQKVTFYFSAGIKSRERLKGMYLAFIERG